MYIIFSSAVILCSNSCYSAFATSAAVKFLIVEFCCGDEGYLFKLNFRRY